MIAADRSHSISILLTASCALLGARCDAARGCLVRADRNRCRGDCQGPRLRGKPPQLADARERISEPVLPTPQVAGRPAHRIARRCTDRRRPPRIGHVIAAMPRLRSDAPGQHVRSFGRSTASSARMPNSAAFRIVSQRQPEKMKTGFIEPAMDGRLFPCAMIRAKLQPLK